MDTDSRAVTPDRPTDDLTGDLVAVADVETDVEAGTLAPLDEPERATSLTPSGRLTYSGVMTSSITLRYTEDADAPTCRHCGGSGREPVRVYPSALQPLVNKLRTAGQQRASYSSARNPEGLGHLHDSYDAIRALVPQAEEAGLDRQAIADEVGVSRAQLFNILTNRVGARS